MSPYMRTRRQHALEDSMLLRTLAGYKPRPRWRTRAECAGAPPDWFDNPHRANTLCTSCPVRMDCLADTIAIETTLPSPVYAEGHIAIRASRRRAHLREHWTVTITHGTARGYHQHHRHNIPIDGCGCREAYSRHAAERRGHTKGAA